MNSEPSISGYPNNEIDGGEGDDTIFGVAIAEEMVLRGGLGNDTIYAGGFGDDIADDYGEITYDSEEDGAIYLYGDDGHDRLFGADRVPFQYFFGGEGDDFIQGGAQETCTDCADSDGLFYVDGGAGDDIIKPYLDLNGENVA